jgi:tRNA (guanine-N7-)-methyltransferase
MFQHCLILSLLIGEINSKREKFFSCTPYECYIALSRAMDSLFLLTDTIPPENRDQMWVFFHSIFGNDNPLVVEIGSGNGHFLVECAVNSPLKNYIGTESLHGRARKFCEKIKKRSLRNIVVFRGDARQFVWEYLFERCVYEFIILFPDPWPKKRHHKHRLLTEPFIRMMETRLVDNGTVSVATDHEEYRDRIIHEFRKVGAFTNPYTEGYTLYPPDYPKTLFEKKLRERGKNIYFMKFKKERS